MNTWGSPGREGLGPDNRVVFNEALAQPVLPDLDKIELYSATNTLNLLGWTISDTPNDYAKFRFVTNTVMTPDSYLVLDANQLGFGLKSGSENDLYLIEANSAGDLLRFVDHIEFGASSLNTSFARLPNGTGEVYPLFPTTFGGANHSY